MKKISAKLQSVFDAFDACVRCAAAGNTLRHVLGGGQTDRPRFLFLFINPTHHNASCRPAYPGTRRYPFLGIRHFYRILASVGFVDAAIIEDIYRRGWETEDEHRVEQSLTENGVYLTNLVKCAQPHADNPSWTTVLDDLPLLHEEISAVRPRYIVTFGRLPCRALTGKDILLRNWLDAARRGVYQPLLSLPIGNRTYKILPCHFPIGHGNQSKASDILTYVKAHF